MNDTRNALDILFSVYGVQPAARGLLFNAADWLLGIGPASPYISVQSRDIHLRRTEDWHLALNVSGRACEACGLDSTQRETIIDGLLYCPPCAAQNPRAEKCVRCDDAKTNS